MVTKIAPGWEPVNSQAQKIRVKKQRQRNGFRARRKAANMRATATSREIKGGPMPTRTARKQSSASRRRSARMPADDAGRDLRTGSLAPAQLPSRSVEEEIGAEVRRLRKSLDLTVAELGTAAGISGGMLSKIENGTISPSLATLSALAKALNVSISSLFAETDERRDCSFVKAGTGVRIDRRGTKAGHQYDLLGHSLAGDIGVDPFLITLKGDAQPYTNFRHAGVEFIYMLSGKVRYRHADKTYVLEPGDALFFDAAARHGPEELIKAPMQYLSIIIYPRRS
jgi:transcriptional regulator with XRE-family HTH domain